MITIEITTSDVPWTPGRLWSRMAIPNTNLLQLELAFQILRPYGLTIGGTRYSGQSPKFQFEAIFSHMFYNKKYGKGSRDS